jgi:hypothetical protein
VLRVECNRLSTGTKVFQSHDGLQRLRILCAALSYGDGHGGREDVVLLLAGRRNLRRPRGSKPPIDHFVMVITSRTQAQR